MVLSRFLEPPDLLVVTLTGVVTTSDQKELETFARDVSVRAGSVRALLRLDQFSGWRPDAVTDKNATWLRDDEPVTKIAIVGEPEWRAPVLTLMAQPIRRMPVEYFGTEARARRWLGQAPSHTLSF